MLFRVTHVSICLMYIVAFFIFLFSIVSYKGAKTGKLISTKKLSLYWTDDEDEENVSVFTHSQLVSYSKPGNQR